MCPVVIVFLLNKTELIIFHYEIFQLMQITNGRRFPGIFTNNLNKQR